MTDWNEILWLSGKQIDLMQLLAYAKNRPPLNREMELYLKELENDIQKAIWVINSLEKEIR